jgi:WD40 repeat protein
VVFNPKDGGLIITTRDGCSIRKAGTWNLIRQIPREASVGEGRPQRGALSPDGELFATGWGNNVIRIIQAGTGEVLMDLEVLAQIPLCFSPDSDRLYVLGQYYEIYFWDLHQIRQHLRTIALDWPTENL